MVGTCRTPYRCAVLGFSSTLSFTSSTWPSCSAAIASSTGLTIRHGPPYHGTESTKFRREPSGDVAHERRADGLLHTAGEQPLPDPAAVQPGQVRHPQGERGRVGGQPVLTVEHVLEHVVRGVADIWLGVDDQPRCSYRSENVVTVQVRAQQ